MSARIFLQNHAASSLVADDMLRMHVLLEEIFLMSLPLLLKIVTISSK